MLTIFSKLSITALAVSLGVTTPMRYAPLNAASNNKYISEVKVGMDKTEAGATKELLEEGYTILKKDGKYADLNEEAGSKDTTIGRGQKKVYLGYKTTNDPNEAITDLAVMNMRGGYSVKDYEVLMETRLKSEIIPFIDRFIVTLQEYRENLQSLNPANKARAEYMKTMLNKLQDDDTGGLLGDLLVNETKYEMGDEAYNALSTEEKKKHADIATILMQANGKSTLSMETLLTKASDTAENSWIDRLNNRTLDDLKDELVYEKGVDVTEVDTTLDKLYEDSAKQILEKWPTFSHDLMDYDEKANELVNLDEHQYDEMIDAMNKANPDSGDKEKNGDAIVADLELKNDCADVTQDLELVVAKESLDDVPYDSEDGSTLTDFFMQDAGAFTGDKIRNLYPIVASLSAGQIAGLDFLSIQDLVTIATADATNYATDDLGDMTPASIYEDVNREIFEKGKVALTNKALRAEAMKNEGVFNNPLGSTTYILWGATAVATAGLIASKVIGKSFSKAFDTISNNENKIREFIALKEDIYDVGNRTGKAASYFNKADESFYNNLKEIVGDKNASRIVANGRYEKTINSLADKSKIASYLGFAFSVAMAILAIVSIYSTFKDLIAYYQVEYSPIPKYIVEETDVTETVNGVTTVKRNDTAYYQVAECNRKPGSEFYDVLQNYADLNGDVGKEWLALYFVKQENHAPIKANSLKVVTGTSNIPSGYTELGIHKFGSTNAYNLTSEYYCYNDTPKGTYVYFQVDESVLAKASAIGSNFSTGSAVLFSGIGAVVGAGIAIAILLILRKRKETIVSE